MIFPVLHVLTRRCLLDRCCYSKILDRLIRLGIGIGRSDFAFYLALFEWGGNRTDGGGSDAGDLGCGLGLGLED